MKESNQTNNEQNSSLASAPLKSLLLKYSIPTTITLMVNYLYNIVDQIFVGQGVGVTGMAATNVAFPLVILVNAIALLLGDGCAANMSLCHGGGNKEEADKTVSHAVTLIISSGIFILLLCRIFSSQIVVLFGSTETAYIQSLTYLNIIAFGIPFQLMCPAFTAIIRADGSPKYTMKCMIIGAVINLILDPIFIFNFKLGVAGAAIATVIGQIVSGLMCLLYLRNMNTVTINKQDLLPTPKLTGKILSLGFPSLLTQSLTAFVQIIMNNLMRKYGSTSIYGSDIALSVYGMIVKVYQISHSMFVGVSSAIQPINGFNYGAKNYKRVHDCYKLAAKTALTISTVWFIIFIVFPKFIGSLFVSDDLIYLDCAEHFFRIYMGAFFLYGIHMTTASFFQGIGKPKRALLIPLSRQALFLIPLSLILSSRFGLYGALLAVPIADILVFIVSILLIKSEFNSWRKNSLL